MIPIVRSLRDKRKLWQAGVGSLLLAAGLSAQAQSITNGLVAYWSFDNKDFTDKFGVYNGTANGADPIPFIAGKAGFGQAIDLNGTDQFVEITGGNPDDLAFMGGSVSISGWFTVEGFEKSWQALIAKGEGSNWRLARHGGDPGMSYAGGLGDTPFTKDVSDGGWHHFVAISDAAGANFGGALYIDGVLDGMTAGNANLAANGKPVRIGENPDATGRKWHGAVDDVGIWNRVLTEKEITQIYNNGTGTPLSSFFAPPLDSDGDGIPDSWEIQYGLNPFDPKDALQDCNKNGVTNLDEYKAGLDPCDVTAPTILGAKADSTFTSVIVTFSKGLDPATATNLANYTITPSLAVTGATYKGTTVTLTTAAQTPGATAYTLKVSNVADLSKNKITAASAVTFYSFLTATSGVLPFDVWTNITGGTSVDLLTGDPRYPASPSLDLTLHSFNSRDAFPDDSHENYGSRIQGLLTPTNSGGYYFFLRSDDASQLFLSTDATEANLSMIAEEPGCCNAFQEPGTATQTTPTPINLVAGKSYYIRSLHKEGGGGDYVQVAWRAVGDTTPAANLSPIPGSFLTSLVPLPVDSDGSFTAQVPAPKSTVKPNVAVTVSHLDGKTPWTAAAVSLAVDGDVVKSTFTKVGNVATLTYTPPAFFPAKTAHSITVNYPDAGGKATSVTWPFKITSYNGQVNDVVSNYPALLLGTANSTTNGGGHTGKAGDYAIDFTPKGGGWVDIINTYWINPATSKDELTFSFWENHYKISNSSSFWANSASAGRGFQAHTPWGDDTIYFDTMGCCDGANQRISANISTFPAYVDDGFWTNWHHFAFTKKADQKNIYIDGTLFLNGSSMLPLLGDFTEIGLGTDGIPGGDFLDGIMDDFAVYSKAITADDASKLAKGTSPTALTAANLIAYWDFNTPVSKPSNIGNGLVAYWNFDASDFSDPIGSFNGKPVGTNALLFVDGKFGKAVRLNGADQYIDITNSATALAFAGSSVSISGWFKVEASGFDKSWQAVVSKGEGTAYRVARRGSENNIAYAGGVGEGPDDVPAVNDGAWHHFVAVTDSTGKAFGTALYVDGVLHSVNTNKAVITKGTKDLFIGENPDATGRQFKGQLDDIGIWNRVLGADEVAALYNGGAGTPIGAVASVAPKIVLHITSTGNSASISWTPTGGTLQSSPTLGSSAVWTTVGTANPATVTLTGAGLYYRVQQ